MRYCFISDIHGNLEAFTAVIDTAAKERIDKYLCIGDVVGYGADPSECIKLVQSLDPDVLVAGNHEWGVAGLLDMDYFSEYARAAVEWTKGILGKAEMDYLKSFRLVDEEEGFVLVHGGPQEPDKFPYIMDSDDAASAMKLMKKPLLFIGHTHIAEVYYSDKGKVRQTIEPRIKIDDGRTYVINVGSVGQPRDMDPRASFAVFDTDENVVELKRIAYDIKKAGDKILKAGLPEMLALRLSEGR